MSLYSPPHHHPVSSSSSAPYHLAKSSAIISDSGEESSLATEQLMALDQSVPGSDAFYASSSTSSPFNSATPPPSASNVMSAPGSISPHQDLCRTISDTLGAEFSEYVTRIKTTPYGQQLLPTLSQQYSQEQTGLPFDEASSASPSSTSSFGDCSSYTARVEFGLKLGYTEAQVQLALIKLGPSAGQNELLAELIKLGAVNNNNAGGSQSANSGIRSTVSSSQPDLRDQMIGGNGDGCAFLDEPGGGCLSGADSHGDLSSSETGGLRHIVIDGSNVAMSHGNKEQFSCMGLRICVDWFKARGHREITVFVPSWRKEATRPDAPIKDQDILLQLENERLLVFTPSRNVGGRRMVCYDDRYILKLASESDGIVVSNDNYRDLVNENPEFKKIVEERLLMFSFVNDRFMPPDDPLGRKGPSLDNFLRRKPRALAYRNGCPYGKKCTYGNKCKYYHPERGNLPQRSVTERLVEQAKVQLEEVKARSAIKQRATHTSSLPPSLQVSDLAALRMAPLCRTMSVASATPLTVAQMAPSQPGLLDSATHLASATGGGGSQPQHQAINLHRKLQRQLTLNPGGDHRLDSRLQSDVPQQSPCVGHFHCYNCGNNWTEEASQQQFDKPCARCAANTLISAWKLVGVDDPTTVVLTSQLQRRCMSSHAMASNQGGAIEQYQAHQAQFYGHQSGPGSQGDRHSPVGLGQLSLSRRSSAQSNSSMSMKHSPLQFANSFHHV